MSNTELEKLFFPIPKTNGRFSRVAPDCPTIHHELKRKDVTKQLLSEEFKQAHGSPAYQLSHYRSLFTPLLHYSIKIIYLFDLIRVLSYLRGSFAQSP
jgi:hypothetical protein